jgi:hypothetical protein
MKKMKRISLSGRVIAMMCAFGLSLLGAHALAEIEGQQASDGAAKESKGEASGAEGTGTFVLVDSDFAALMVARDTDFSKFNKIKFFPSDRSEMEISKKGEPESIRSWRKATDKELDAFAENIDDMVTEVFRNRDTFTLVEESSGEGILAVQVRLKEFVPMMVRADDVQDRTIGSQQGLGNLGHMAVNVVLVDVAERKMVGVIQDMILMDSQHATRNTRSSQSLIVRRSFRDWLTEFYGSLETLKQNNQ